MNCCAASCKALICLWPSWALLLLSIITAAINPNAKETAPAVSNRVPKDTVNPPIDIVELNAALFTWPKDRAILLVLVWLAPKAVAKLGNNLLNEDIFFIIIGKLIKTTGSILLILSSVVAVLSLIVSITPDNIVPKEINEVKPCTRPEIACCLSAKATFLST